jgi:sec-independent protein translocase protein TatA
VLEDLLSPVHLLLLMVVALLIFGPRRLPELGGAVGKTVREFQRAMQDVRANGANLLSTPEEEPRPAVSTPPPPQQTL